MKKAALETVKTGDSALDRLLSAVKQNLDQITGQARNLGPLEPLPADASLAQVVARLNEITDRMQ